MYPNYTMPFAGQVQNMYQTQNPYQSRLEAIQQSQTARYEIIHVNGENGARAFRMAPNSQSLLLDDTAPIVWLCQSDGAGYHTVTPYAIAPYQAEPAPDYNALNARITRLEELINESHIENTESKPAKRISKPDRE